MFLNGHKKVKDEKLEDIKIEKEKEAREDDFMDEISYDESSYNVRNGIPSPSVGQRYAHRTDRHAPASVFDS